MTTIAYKEGVIAYDSFATEGCVIVDYEFNKRVDRNGVNFFVAGEYIGIDDLIKAYFDPGHKIKNDTFALVHDKGRVFSVGVESGEDLLWRFNETKPYSIGTGSSFAFAAMDMGASAKQAVKIASNRDVYTGGKIKTFRVK